MRTEPNQGMVLLRKIVEQLGQAEVARMVCLHPSYIHRYRRGHEPSIESAYRIWRGIGIPIEAWVVVDDDDDDDDDE